MSRIRLTRQESREQTRNRLLEAAAAVIANQGFAATSVEDIVEHAGYTRGAFYSNFHSRIDLFTQLLHANQADIKQSFRHLLDANLSAAASNQAATSSAGKCDCVGRPLMLWIEARHYAVRDMGFRPAFNALTLQLCDVIACHIDDFYKRTHITPTISCRSLALAMMALIEGTLFLRMTMANEAPDDSLGAILHRIFVAAVLSNETPGSRINANTAAR